MSLTAMCISGVLGAVVNHYSMAIFLGIKAYYSKPIVKVDEIPKPTPKAKTESAIKPIGNGGYSPVWKF